MKKILVTGSRGFISSHLIDKLLENDDNQIVATNGSTYKWLDEPPGKLEIVYKDYSDVINTFKPDVIYHVDACSTNTDHCWDKNVNDTKELLDSIKNYTQRANSRPIFNFISSIVVDNYPLNLYAASKATGEILVESYHDMGFIYGNIFNIPAVVGSRNRHGLVRDVIAKLKTVDPTLYLLGESPGSIKPYIDIKRLIQFLIQAQTFYRSIYVDKYFVHPTTSVSVLWAAELIMKTIEVKKEIVWLGESANFKGDQKIIIPTPSNHVPKFTSEEAIIDGVKDILINDYGERC